MPRLQLLNPMPRTLAVARNSSGREFDELLDVNSLAEIYNSINTVLPSHEILSDENFVYKSKGICYLIVNEISNHEEATGVSGLCIVGVGSDANHPERLRH
ncbi:hypothetical protein E2C01_045889 [Portunus trituberculatus]|uniref:Uncharacterized protein n=1 Tax=Portunus trituberculatus TaxID=210409 RepID=A0A5B7G375_PORTR|nr:hypothetical protein [Portunus trituberculatus]